MANLYGQEAPGTGKGDLLFGRQVLSERNQAQGQQLGLPEYGNAHAGGAGSQIEANDPFFNFEDVFNKNRGFAQEATNKAGEKLAEESGAAFGTLDRSTMQPRPVQKEAPTLSPNAPQTGEQRQRPDQAPVAQMPQLKRPTDTSLPTATPTNYLTSLQTQSDASNEPKLTQLKPDDNAGFLQGFGDQPVEAHQYEVKKDLDVKEDGAPDSGVDDVGGGGSAAVTPALEPEVAAPGPVNAPAPAQAAPLPPSDSAPVAPVETAPPAPGSELDPYIDQAKKDQEGQVGPTEDELKRLDQLRKINETLGAYGQDQGLGLMQEMYGPEATSWDAEIANTGGLRDVMKNYSDAYKGKDLEYEQKLDAQTEQQKQMQEGGRLQQMLFEDAKADRANAPAADTEHDLPGSGLVWSGPTVNYGNGLEIPESLVDQPDGSKPMLEIQNDLGLKTGGEVGAFARKYGITASDWFRLANMTSEQRKAWLKRLIATGVK